LLCRHLLPADLELAVAVAVLPGSDDGARRQLKFLDAPLQLITGGADRYRPVARVQGDRLDDHVVRTRIDHAGDILAVPVHDQQHKIPVRAVATPLTDP